jgi:antitoxin component HigA of HigAB toxin-antitoxin module
LFIRQQYEIQCYEIQCYEIQCYEIQCYEIQCYEIQCYEIQCYEIQCYEKIIVEFQGVISLFHIEQGTGTKFLKINLIQK